MGNLEPGSTLDEKKGTISDYADYVAEKIIVDPAKTVLDDLIEINIPANIAAITSIAESFIP